MNNELYKQYQRDKFSNKILTNKPVEEDISIFKNVKKFEIDYKNLISISDLPCNHKAYQYLCNRNIPKHVFSRIKWTDDFPKLIEKTIGSKYNNTILPKCGIVFELKELDGKITGYQIRSIEKNISKSQRFVICSINDEHGYYFDTINYDKPIFIVEGCIDSLFLENSISTLSSTLWKLHPSENCIYFNDQEPRNSSVCKQIDKCIKYGYNVVILPKEYENMDINDIVNSGVSYKELPDLFQKYTYSGLKAKIKFAEWKK